MAEEVWQSEKISENCILFRRVHEQLVKNIKDKEIPPSAFKNNPLIDPNLSTHWNRYISPDEIRGLISKEFKTNTDKFKDPKQFFVLSVNVREITLLNSATDFPLQEVKHTPKQQLPEKVGFPNDRSHASILGDKTDEEVRVKLARIAQWELHPF